MMLRRSLGKVVDWRKISREDYMMAMERSPINDLELRFLLQNALTEETDDGDVIYHGIDQSYYYEGYEVALESSQKISKLEQFYKLLEDSVKQ